MFHDRFQIKIAHYNHSNTSNNETGWKWYLPSGFTGHDEVTGFLDRLQKTMAKLHPNTTEMEVLLLVSKKGCPEQVIHRDSCTMSDARFNNKRLAFASIGFTMLFALMPDTKLKIAANKTNANTTKVIEIADSNGIIFPADIFHAGAAYDKENVRLFVAVGTNEFPCSNNEVSIPLLSMSDSNDK